MFPNWDPQSITANGAVFNYYRTPAASGSGKPVLVLQHGFSDNGLCWVPVAEELAAEYDIIMPDARGHGLSARVERGQKIDQAADLAAVLEALGISQAIVAGHSMGAHIASDLAARFPRLTSKVVLEDPPWFIPRPDAPQFGRGSMEDSPLGKWMVALREKNLEQIMAECREEHPTWPEPYVRAWCLGKIELDLNFLAAEQSMGSNWQERVLKIECPTLVITADPSMGGIVGPEAAEFILKSNPKMRVVNYPGVGHHVRFAIHAEYMRTFKDFLRNG